MCIPLPQTGSSDVRYWHKADVHKLGSQPINAQISYYYNVERPDLTGGDSQLRAQWTFLFPTK